MSAPQKIILWSLIILAIFGVFRGSTIFSSISNNPHEIINFESREIKISGQIFKVDLATSGKQQQRGLSYRNKISENTGMLFVFNKPTKPGFWMKDMSFSIDIIWLDSNRNVVFINKNISPETYPQVFESPLPVKYVLEIKSGEVDRLKIKIGSHMSFKRLGFLWF